MDGKLILASYFLKYFLADFLCVFIFCWLSSLAYWQCNLKRCNAIKHSRVSPGMGSKVLAGERTLEYNNVLVKWFEEYVVWGREGEGMVYVGG